MTTPLPEPDLNASLFGFDAYHPATLKAYGAAEYKRAISEAIEILSDTQENTRYDALQEIKKLGATP